MSLDHESLESLIRNFIPDCAVTIDHLRDDGHDHLAVSVVSATFAGMPRIDQHRAIYKALKGAVDPERTPITLQTAER